VDEFQSSFEIFWISTLATRDRWIRASVPRSINKPFPGRVEVRLCPLSPFSFESLSTYSPYSPLETLSSGCESFC
jgi:hypothetical protein